MNPKYEKGDILALLDTYTKQIFEYVLIVNLKQDFYCTYSLSRGFYTEDVFYVFDEAMDVKKVA